MSAATKLPTLNYFEWSRPDAPKPTLSAGIAADDTTITWSTAPKDEDGTILTGDFILGIKRADGYTENVYVPAGGVAADGLSASGCIRGVDLAGTDYNTSNSAFAVSHLEGEAVFCVVAPVEMKMFEQVFQGTVASGANLFILGDETASTVTIYRRTDAGNQGLFRWFVTNGKTQYSNDGTNWINFDDSSSSDLVKVSATDTSAGYLLTKIIAGSNMVVTQTDTGSDESLTLSTSLPDQVTTHTVYTPAYLTGDTPSALAVFDSVNDGSFRATDIDGTAYNVDAIDLTSATTEAEVATLLQTALRAATGGSETVAYSGGFYVFTSGDTTSSSNFAVLTTSTGTVGTDLSGAGGTPYLNADSGSGTATAAVLDPTADEGKVILLNSDGNVDSDFLANVIAPTQTTYNLADSPATWTKPTSTDPLESLKYVRVQIWGGGGGGKDGATGGGGGGGAYNEMIIQADDLGATETVTIGAGGAAASTGGTSTFGSHLSAYGGEGGVGGGNGGGGGGTLSAGGTTATGDGGEPAGGDFSSTPKSSAFGGGAGDNSGAGAGNSQWGGGGGGGTSGAGDSVWGGGGGAQTGGSAGTSVNGGDGGAPTTNGTVPGGGGGGSATTPGEGGAGRCIVTEYFN